MDVLSTVTITDFSAHIGKFFQLRAENGECQLSLKEVRDNKRHAQSGQNRTPFSLIFSGPAGMSFQQGTYTIDHEALGELHLFLVPVGMEDEAVLLEAVFN